MSSSLAPKKNHVVLKLACLDTQTPRTLTSFHLLLFFIFGLGSGNLLFIASLVLSHSWNRQIFWWNSTNRCMNHWFDTTFSTANFYPKKKNFLPELVGHWLVVASCTFFIQLFFLNLMMHLFWGILDVSTQCVDNKTHAARKFSKNLEFWSQEFFSSFSNSQGWVSAGIEISELSNVINSRNGSSRLMTFSYLRK